MSEPTAKKVMTEAEFIGKWLAFAELSVADMGSYWTSTPCRLFWVLQYEAVVGWDVWSMAEDLLALYPHPTAINSSILHARAILAS